MRLVLDASAAIEVVLDRAKARGFAQLLEAADEVLAPELIVPEIVNTIWKYHQFESLSLSVCDRAIELAAGLVDVLVSASELYREAFLLARAARQPAYDMFYLALARREDAGILTTDTSRRKEAERQGIRVLSSQRASARRSSSCEHEGAPSFFSSVIIGHQLVKAD